MNSFPLTADIFFLSVCVLIGKYCTVIFVMVLLTDPEIPSHWHHALQEFTVPKGTYNLNIQEKRVECTNKR